jgi:lipoic acid synthetase
LKSKFPDWLRKRLPATGAVRETEELLASLKLNTVCKSAHCPNLGECFARHTATFLLLGDICTRNCRFCAVEGGRPAPPDSEEPLRVAEAVRRLGLTYVVLTSVSRDDLPDGGAGQFAAAVQAIHALSPDTSVEVLTPDFQGDRRAVETVASSGIAVFNHNVETAPRLYQEVRPEADFQRSLKVLEMAGQAGSITKSGLMVGLGERPAEVEEALVDLRKAGIAIVTIGQYLSPSPRHLPVREFIHPDVFAEYGRMGQDLGFTVVASAPFVRSSYRADELAVLRSPSMLTLTPL